MINDLKEAQKLNRLLLVKIIDKIIECEKLKHQLEMLNALGIQIQTERKETTNAE